MGEARRRKLAGNTEPDKQWHERKAADKHSKKVVRELITAATPITPWFNLSYGERLNLIRGRQ